MSHSGVLALCRPTDIANKANQTTRMAVIHLPLACTPSIYPALICVALSATRVYFGRANRNSDERTNNSPSILISSSWAPAQPYPARQQLATSGQFSQAQVHRARGQVIQVHSSSLARLISIRPVVVVSVRMGRLQINPTFCIR